MAIQNSINAMLGTVAGAAAMGKHVSEQSKANELEKSKLKLKLSEEEEAAYKAEHDLNANSLEISKEMQKDLDPEVTSRTDLDENSYLELKQDLAAEKAKEAMKDFSQRKDDYLLGVQKSKPSSKRLDMANKAFMEASDAVMARRQLNYNVDMAKKRIAITKQALGGKYNG